MDLRSANLSGINIINTDLSDANLKSSVLSNVNLNCTNLQGTNFIDADLTSITYAGCTGTPVGTPAPGTLPVCTP